MRVPTDCVSHCVSHCVPHQVSDLKELVCESLAVHAASCAELRKVGWPPMTPSDGL